MGIFSSNYKVFISFKGADVGENFVSHLYSAFEREKIKAFNEENLKKGVEIAPSLQKIINKAKIYIVVFSEHYPNSPCCLDELLKINERRKKKNRKVIPVFYGIDPADVQELKGNYGTAIHCYREDPIFRDKVNEWKNALMDISTLAGYSSDNPKYRPEAILVEEIVKFISDELREHPIKRFGLGLVAGVAIGLLL